MVGFDVADNNFVLQGDGAAGVVYGLMLPLRMGKRADHTDGSMPAFNLTEGEDCLSRRGGISPGNSGLLRNDHQPGEKSKCHLSYLHEPGQVDQLQVVCRCVVLFVLAGV